jgi:hypothetical protein
MPGIYIRPSISSRTKEGDSYLSLSQIASVMLHQRPCATIDRLFVFSRAYQGYLKVHVNCNDPMQIEVDGRHMADAEGPESDQNWLYA